ncbi:MmcQ/YjbR family DNA-binding protein [Dokdonella sp.]|uniref:MmcQ/YjbR family DNA-binding protein n=1 Tax=Dokdonella sp. TaxID=2291710 RepID=UPI002F3E4744
MDARALKACCARFPGAISRSLGPPYNILLYEVGGRQFAYFKLSDPERWRFSFRATPERFLELTGIPGIKPARYMARFHWVTVVDVRTVPAAYLRELVAWSYRRALASLPKSKQAALAGAGMVPAAAS